MGRWAHGHQRALPCLAVRVENTLYFIVTSIIWFILGKQFIFRNSWNWKIADTNKYVRMLIFGTSVRFVTEYLLNTQIHYNYFGHNSNIFFRVYFGWRPLSLSLKCSYTLLCADRISIFLKKQTDKWQDMRLRLRLNTCLSDFQKREKGRGVSYYYFV
jgi:hypothetical protein